MADWSESLIFAQPINKTAAFYYGTIEKYPSSF